MTLYEWVTNDLLYAPTQTLQTVQSLFNNENNSYFVDWFSCEFCNYTLLFDSETFARKLIAFFSNKAVEIDRIQKLTNFLKNKPITENDLGSIVTQSSESSANSSGKVVNSYSGYNVDNGEFNNSTNSGDSTSKGTTSTSSINRIEQLYNMANYEIRGIYNNLKVELFKFFQVIY